VRPRHLERRRAARHAEDRVRIEGASSLHRADSTAPEGPPDDAAGRAPSV
jgi:hypothetical protein